MREIPVRLRNVQGRLASVVPGIAISPALEQQIDDLSPAEKGRPNSTDAPSGFRAFTSAPRSRSSRTISASPRKAAQDSGLTPRFRVGSLDVSAFVHR